MKVPTKFEVDFHSDRFSVGWEDEVNAYHVWLNQEGTPITPWSSKPAVIYVNKHTTRGTREHRVSRRELASHPKILAAICAINPSLFDQAVKRYEEQEALQAAKARADWIERLTEEARTAGFKLVPLDEQKGKAA